MPNLGRRAVAGNAVRTLKLDFGVRAGQSIQRALVPSDFSGTVAWPIGDGSRFVTGQTIAVDGETVIL